MQESQQNALAADQFTAKDAQPGPHGVEGKTPEVNAEGEERAEECSLGHARGE